MNVKLDMIGIVTRDLGESLRFYRTLGISTPETDLTEPYVEVELPGGVRLSWNKLEMVREIDPDWVEPVGQRMGLAFLCEAPGQVDAVYERLLAAGFSGRRAPWDAFWGQRYAQVDDPDGNAVDLFAPLA